MKKKNILIDIIDRKTGEVVYTKKFPDTDRSLQAWSFFWSMKGDKQHYDWTARREKRKLRKVI